MSNSNDYGTNEDEEEEEVEEEADVAAEVNSVSERLTIFKTILLYAFFIVVKVAILVYLNASVIFFITHVFNQAEAEEAAKAAAKAEAAKAEAAAAEVAGAGAEGAGAGGVAKEGENKGIKQFGGGFFNRAAGGGPPVDPVDPVDPAAGAVKTPEQIKLEDRALEEALELKAEEEAEAVAEEKAEKGKVAEAALKNQSERNEKLTTLLNKLFPSDKSKFDNIFVTCGSRTIYEKKQPNIKKKETLLSRVYNYIFYIFSSTDAGAGAGAAVVPDPDAKPDAKVGAVKIGGGSMAGGAPEPCDNGNTAFEARIKKHSDLKKDKSKKPSELAKFMNKITLPKNSYVPALIKDYYNIRVSQFILTNIDCNIWIKNRIVAWNNSMNKESKGSLDSFLRDYVRYFLIVFGIILSILYLIVLDIFVNLKFIYNYFGDIAWLINMSWYWNTTISDKEKENLQTTWPFFLIIMMIIGIIPAAFLNSIGTIFIMIQKAYYLWIYPLFNHGTEIANIIYQYKTIIAYIFVFSYLLLLYTIEMPEDYNLPIKIIPTLIVIIVLFINLIKFIRKFMTSSLQKATAAPAKAAAA